MQTYLDANPHCEGKEPTTSKKSLSVRSNSSYYNLSHREVAALPRCSIGAPARSDEKLCGLHVSALKHVTILGMPAGAAPATRPQCNLTPLGAQRRALTFSTMGATTW
jgi:hypothetical protein